MFRAPFVARHIEVLIRVRDVQAIKIHVGDARRARVARLYGQTIGQRGAGLEELIRRLRFTVDAEGVCHEARSVAVFFVNGEL